MPTPQKLTDEEVGLMRAWYIRGALKNKLAQHFDVGLSTVSRITNFDIRRGILLPDPVPPMPEGMTEGRKCGRTKMVISNEMRTGVISMFKSGFTKTKIAERFKVSWAIINRIIDAEYGNP